MLCVVGLEHSEGKRGHRVLRSGAAAKCQVSSQEPTPYFLGAQSSSGAKVQLMRMVGHVRQKSLGIPEATPIVQEKIATGIAGLF
jgi:hypothetical protein